MALLNYTTKIDPDKTAQEIARCLSKHGAKSILTDYDVETNIVSAISFCINLNGRDISFRLPCDWRPVYTILTEGKKVPWEDKRRAKFKSDWELQAVRTAWRIVKDWVEAQMALVETNMASTVEVFLPYALNKNGKTMFESVTENPQILLGSGE